MELLEVSSLRTEFRGEGGVVRASDDIGFSVAAGEIVGLVGESGSGKSVASKAIMRLIEPASAVSGGKILFDGVDIMSLSVEAMRRLRARRLSMIFQDPMGGLNPVLTIGDQMTRVFMEHADDMPESAKASTHDRAVMARERALDLLRTVRIPDPEERMTQYPHQFSGGMRQRVMIAMALMCRPSLLIADEPTTALDVTVERQVLQLLRDLQKRFGMAILFISHNLSVIARLCDRVIVMYGGRIMEVAPVRDIFGDPLHPYTQGLLGSIPQGVKADGRLSAIPGEPPDLADPPQGCPFRPRCRFAEDICRTPQALRSTADGRQAACRLVDHRIARQEEATVQSNTG